MTIQTHNRRQSLVKQYVHLHHVHFVGMMVSDVHSHGDWPSLLTHAPLSNHGCSVHQVPGTNPVVSVLTVPLRYSFWKMKIQWKWPMCDGKMFRDEEEALANWLKCNSLLIIRRTFDSNWWAMMADKFTGKIHLVSVLVVSKHWWCCK